MKVVLCLAGVNVVSIFCETISTFLCSRYRYHESFSSFRSCSLFLRWFYGHIIITLYHHLNLLQSTTTVPHWCWISCAQSVCLSNYNLLFPPQAWTVRRCVRCLPWMMLWRRTRTKWTRWVISCLFHFPCFCLPTNELPFVI